MGIFNFVATAFSDYPSLDNCFLPKAKFRGSPMCMPIAAPLIVGGEATGKPFPYHVAIKNIFHPKKPVMWCGGTIIGLSHVLTAMHCFDTYAVYSIQNFVVVAGAYSVVDAATHLDSENIQVRQIKRLHSPMGYAGVSKTHHHIVSETNDIAILELDRPFKFNANIGPACLPQADAESGKFCVVSGWGLLEFSNTKKFPDFLQFAHVEIKPLEECGHDPNDLVSSMLCAGGRERDACQVDSGGPLICRGPKNKAVITGIVSWGRGCASNDSYGVYTRVYSYLEFIRTTLAGETEIIDVPPKACKVATSYKDMICDDDLNNEDCDFDGGDCCGYVNKISCNECTCKN